MANDSGQYNVFLVDDEHALCRALSSILEKYEFAVTTFPSAEECLFALADSTCDLLIVDYRLPGQSGLTLLQTVRKNWPAIPVVILTGYGSVELAVNAMKAGAADFIEKPFDTDSLLYTVRSAICPRTREVAAHRLFGKPLTEAEKRVLQLLLSGKTNREIADRLHRSVRTVEDHRSHLMAKLGARNIVELIQLASHLDHLP